MPNEFDPNVKDRAVRMVLEREPEGRFGHHGGGDRGLAGRGRAGDVVVKSIAA